MMIAQHANARSAQRLSRTSGVYIAPHVLTSSKRIGLLVERGAAAGLRLLPRGVIA